MSSSTMPLGRWMTPQCNHRQPSMKRSSAWAWRGFRLSHVPRCWAGRTRRLQQELRFFSDAFEKENSSLAQTNLS
jgi:hypothetical protein